MSWQRPQTKNNNHSKRTLEDDSDKVDDADDATDILDSCAELESGIALFLGEGWLGPGKEVQVNVFIVNKQKRTIAASGDLR